MASIEVENVGKIYHGGVKAVSDVGINISGRRIHRACRSLGLRQIHAAAHDRRS